MVSISRILVLAAINAFLFEINGYIPAFTSPFRTFFPNRDQTSSLRSDGFDGTNDLEDVDVLWAMEDEEDQSDESNDGVTFVASEEGFFTSRVDEPTNTDNDLVTMETSKNHEEAIWTAIEDDFSRQEDPRKFWNSRLELLKNYHAEYGDIDVPYSYNVRDNNGATINLGHFLSWLRSHLEERTLAGVIPPIIEEELKILGLEWGDFRVAKLIFSQRLREWNDFVKSNELIDPSLRKWVVQQRNQYSRKQKGLSNTLNNEQVKMLLEAGVIPMREERWDKDWNSRLEEWIELKEEDALENMNNHLLLWAWEQWRMFDVICGEISYRGDLPVLLTADRIARLQDVDFYEVERPVSMNVESPDRESFLDRFNATEFMDAVRAYLLLNGHLDIKPSCPIFVNGKHFYSICAKMRAKYRRFENLEKETWQNFFKDNEIIIKELESLDFFSQRFHQDPMQGTFDWWEYYHAFKSQRREFFLNQAKDDSIIKWIEDQKQRFNQLQDNQDDFIDETQYEALASLGIVFDVSDPMEYSTHTFGDYAGRPSAIRKLNNDILPDMQDEAFPERREAILENMTWNLRYEQMRDFMTQKCNSSDLKSFNPRLAQWADNQRLQFQKSIHGVTTPLTDDRIEKLKKIDFDLGLEFKFVGKIDDWETMISSLRHFRDTHGHCFVPMNLPSSPGLGDWVNQKRKAYQQQKLALGQIKELNNIGLDLNATDFDYFRGANKALWNENFEEVKRFREENGHCNLHKPRNFSIEATLVLSWAQQQRDLHWMQKRNQVFLYLTQERFEKLHSLGFNWTTNEII
mmetsp:Transcript_13502/g.20535  ORF Transcript_13502/g.20535 Transcript_13502/m.20535 type:complete len:802 (+) Transcript_13502:233-2638(+)|eukprot:CAMPEP_0178933050 /NCGR_PEP_ID=MMETSP0786-20121207/23024_1 /TAXON_ID=186022 /ORGANISM="Thalassionema frauenfeldii, Strain CCMP 1798" /LENGTH=801 /DNA_ID=CAMNT_0020610543 /DNA_START=199 /DNA_END=2604 /DNA_ORIENTATION=+